MSEPQSVVDMTLRLAFRWCLGLTAALVVFAVALYLTGTSAKFRPFSSETPTSGPPLITASAVIVWLSLVAAVGLLRHRHLRQVHGLSIVGSVAVVVLYTNMLRERTLYGDVSTYLRAAQELSQHVPFHLRYLYPPLYATLLVPFLPLGEQGMLLLLWIVNLLSLALFSILLTRTLVRYGLGNHVSAIISFGFLAINAPLMRTLEHVQINLHVANLLLLTLLWYPRSVVLSAAALALAAHLKASPIVLALPFLLRRDWRWMACFCATMIALTTITFIPYGSQPFVDYLHNLKDIYAANVPTYHDASVDSLFRTAAHVLSVPADAVSAIVLAMKAIILLFVLLTMDRAMRAHAYVDHGPAATSVHNGVPVLMMFMLLGSPLLWEHHPVLVALPYLITIKRVRTPRQLATYGLAFALEFLMPSTDYFPWSFARLVSPLLLIALMFRTVNSSGEGYLWSFVNRAEGVFESFAKRFSQEDEIASLP